MTGGADDQRDSSGEVSAQLAWLDTVDPELPVRLSKQGPRYTSYPTAPEWVETVGEPELVSRLERADAEGAGSPLSLYVHLPFCQSMCLYCGCNVVIARRPERADAYLDHLARELDLVCAKLPARRRVSQLHLGGGTPTFLDERRLLRLVRELRSRFELLPDAEVALEIDPVVTRREQLALLRGAGFNRVSLGVQDFTPEVQETVGRVQTFEQTRDLFEYARWLGYSGINFDLIYGLPRQRLETFERTLELVVGLGPDRVAVFAYAHVPWMRPHQRRLDEALLPGPAERFRLFAAALRRFLSAGYLQIGMDHFARQGDELARARLARRLRRNFQGYTVNPASDLLAFGITAISEVQGCYVQNVKTLPRYYRSLEEGRLAVERGRVLTDEDVLRRQVIHDILCNYHADLGEACAPLGLDPRAHFAGELVRLEECEREGLVERIGLAFELTPLGRILARNVAMVFDAYLAKKSSTAPLYSRTV
jgi:oxygen-independent coproporphyrinogen III oxidase